MKQLVVIFVSVALLLSSCTSYTASGAVVGGEFGHVIGSAIGGISGGWRGHHMGSLIGTVGGVVAGAAIGAAVEQSANRERYERDERAANDHHERHHGQRDRDYIQNDRLFEHPSLVIRHAAIYDSDHNGVLTRGEECTVVFEVMNTSSMTVYDVFPFVEDVTGNRHVKVSPNLRVESIAPNSGIRYTASILADRKLKDGEILVRVGVAQGQQRLDSQTQEFRVPTRKH